MKRFLSAALVAVSLVVSSLAVAAGPSASMFPPKSPLRYIQLRYGLAAPTSSVTAAVIGALPPGGCVVKDVVLTQATAGSTGTSWTANVKRNAVSIFTTVPGFTQAAGDGKVTNAATSPMGAFTNPTGGTQPVIAGNVAASATVTIAAGLTATEKVTVNGVDFVAIASGATGNQFNLGADENANATNLKNAINASSSAAVKGAVVATVASAVVTVTARTAGTDGNAITLARTGAHLTVSSATLASGFNAMSSGGELLTVDITLSGSYSPGPTGAVTVYCEPRN